MTTKILEASIKDGKLLIEGLNPDDVKILCTGEADSTGFAIFGEDFTTYIANTQPDLNETIEKLIVLTDKMSAVAGQMVIKSVSGGSGSPAVGVSEALDVDSKKEFDKIKKELEDLKLI
ncbi:hypothetical protein [Aliivibrio fischeri]|uniref:Uncharacterized protein n=1 Tax=Aliivibrio fischeri SR5 TaxID=1088719 RepID=A0AAV3EW32_ALIFS|nr:hypothetical protein [Aliivibrio fischeri]EHN70913.1 hypothetical protein VFSR5_0693 [Aliivibrio fischeri SR5]